MATGMRLNASTLLTAALTERKAATKVLAVLVPLLDIPASRGSGACNFILTVNLSNLRRPVVYYLCRYLVVSDPAGTLRSLLVMTTSEVRRVTPAPGVRNG